MTSDEMVVRILLNACDLLEKRGWTQGSMARDANGDACSVNSDAAMSYCLSGALVKSWRELDCANENFYFQLFETRFSEVILRKYSYKRTLTRWNDDIATHREAVVELIYAVIKSIQSDSSESFRATTPADPGRRVNEWLCSRFLKMEQGKLKQAALRDLAMRVISMTLSWRPSQPKARPFCGRRPLRLFSLPVLSLATSQHDDASSLCPHDFSAAAR